MTATAKRSASVGAAGTGSGLWRRVQLWCGGDDPARAIAAQAPLRRAQHEFCRSLHDIGGPRCGLLRTRVRAAGSLGDLWHLRSELFAVVALHAGEAEAKRRLRSLAHHFPSRSPGSGFAPLR